MGRPYRLVAAVTFGGAPPAHAPEPNLDADRNGSSSTTSSSGGGDANGSGGDANGSGARGTVSTSSMDGSESEAAPLLLRAGGAAALAPREGLLNAAPGAGRYAVRLAVHPGASPGDELLALEAAAGLWPPEGSADVGGAGGPAASGCVVVEGAKAELCREGLLLPAAPLLRALASSGGRQTALVVVDFERRLGGGSDSSE